MEQQGQAASPSAPSAQAPAHSPHRMSSSLRTPQSPTKNYDRARLIAALLTHIYGADAETYFDEAFGTNLSDKHEFHRMSAQISPLITSQINRSGSLARIPWDPLKHPRGRDGRFIEKYGIDAFTAAQTKISASLDPNITPTTGRTSDDIRPLLEHLNLLDQSQLHHLAADYEVAPNQTSKSPFTDAIHHQLYREEPNEQTLLPPHDEKPQYENAFHRHSDPPATIRFVSTDAPQETANATTSDVSAASKQPEDDTTSQDTPEGTQHNILEILNIVAPGLYSEFTRGGVILGIQPAEGTQFEDTDNWSEFITVDLGDGKYILIDPRGDGIYPSSSPMIYYDPSMSAAEVAEALRSDEFLNAWYDYKRKRYEAATGKNDFQDADVFIAARKAGFAQAAPIIEGLVFDVVRSMPGGEGAYAIYVISEKGIIGYVKQRVDERVDDITSAVEFARQNPLEAGKYAVVAVALDGRILGLVDSKGAKRIVPKRSNSNPKPDLRPELKLPSGSASSASSKIPPSPGQSGSSVPASPRPSSGPSSQAKSAPNANVPSKKLDQDDKQTAAAQLPDPHKQPSKRESKPQQVEKLEPAMVGSSSTGSRGSNDKPKPIPNDQPKASDSTHVTGGKKLPQNSGTNQSQAKTSGNKEKSSSPAPNDSASSSDSAASKDIKSTETTFELTLPQSKGLIAEIGDDGIITFAIAAGEDSPVRGTAMFKKMLNHFGGAVKGIRGVWTYGDNLRELNRLTKSGMSVAQAAEKTWTGKRAIDSGFKSMKVIEAVGTPGNYSRIIVVFE
jgi:hypothetical protein